MRSFMSAIGVMPEVLEVLWRRYGGGGEIPTRTKLLWAVNFLREYNTGDLLHCRWRVTRKTYCSWVWRVLKTLFRSMREVS